MKAPTRSTQASGHSFPRHLKILGLSFLLGNLASCSSGSKSSATFQPNHWYKVRSNPPTYFPKGVPAGHPTGFSDGSWVYSGDKDKTRYFIPAHSVATKNLVAEAMSTMTAEGRKELDKNNPGDVGQAIGTTVKNGSIVVGFGILRVLFGMGP